jgi:hypothetical protein
LQLPSKQSLLLEMNRAPIAANPVVLLRELLDEGILTQYDLQSADTLSMALVIEVGGRKRRLEAFALREERTIQRIQAQSFRTKEEIERACKLHAKQAAEYRRVARASAIRVAQVLLNATRSRQCTAEELKALARKTYGVKPEYFYLEDLAPVRNAQ